MGCFKEAISSLVSQHPEGKGLVTAVVKMDKHRSELIFNSAGEAAQDDFSMMVFLVIFPSDESVQLGKSKLNRNPSDKCGEVALIRKFNNWGFLQVPVKRQGQRALPQPYYEKLTQWLDENFHGNSVSKYAFFSTLAQYTDRRSFASMQFRDDRPLLRRNKRKNNMQAEHEMGVQRSKDLREKFKTMKVSVKDVIISLISCSRTSLTADINNSVGIPSPDSTLTVTPPSSVYCDVELPSPIDHQPYYTPVEQHYTENMSKRRCARSAHTYSSTSTTAATVQPEYVPYKRQCRRLPSVRPCSDPTPAVVCGSDPVENVNSHIYGDYREVVVQPIPVEHKYSCSILPVSTNTFGLINSSRSSLPNSPDTSASASPMLHRSPSYHAIHRGIIDEISISSISNGYVGSMYANEKELDSDGRSNDDSVFADLREINSNSIDPELRTVLNIIEEFDQQDAEIRDPWQVVNDF